MLDEDEKCAIIPLFLRKSEFKFEIIAKKLSGKKGSFCYYKDKNSEWIAYKFNYDKDQLVSGCPVTAQLCDVFEAKDNEDAWLEAACEVYTQGVGKSRYEIMNDIWHALFFFDDEGHLRAFAKEKLQLDDEHAEMFAKIKIPVDYASLSLKAIRKILPYMKYYGMIYPHAVFMANLTAVIPSPVDPDSLLPMLPRQDADDIVETFNDFGKHKTEIRTKEEYVKRYVAGKYHVDESALGCLYHPSMIETFPKVYKEDTRKGCLQLGSPRTNSLRNPMAMHSLFRMRRVINTLLAKGIIDQDTTIRIEFARELNDANRRAAIRQIQRENEKKRKEYADKIREAVGHDYKPTDDDILKYELWEEQNHICLYTGETIRLSDLFDAGRYDIEHTIPRSVGGDSTKGNLTICQSRFNREVKRAQMPSQLANHEDILERIEHWKEKVDELDKQLKRQSTKGVSDKDTKDRIIQKIHRLKMEHDYWRDKYARFTMTEVPEGFARRQGVDISVISRYARLYLKSLFRDVYIVKGIATADFREIWGLQEEREKKARVNHCHHAIDAITIACIGKAEYDQLAQYYHNLEERHWGMTTNRPSFPKPWRTFTEDVKAIEQSLIVSHYSRDNMRKHTRKRIHGTKDEYMQGDTARGALHDDYFYGRIKRNDELCFVKRYPVEECNVKEIVDDAVRQAVLNAIERYGTLAKACENGIWLNEAKGVRIKKVRCYAKKAISSPVEIRTNRDISRFDYKRPVYANNDGNYLMSIYEGTNNKGKTKREFALTRKIDAVTVLKRSSNAQHLQLVPQVSEMGLPIKYVLRLGQMVLLQESPYEDLCLLADKDIIKRLYKIIGLSYSTSNGCVYGYIALRHHQEARKSEDIPEKKGVYKANEQYRPTIKLSHLQFHALVEGQDFIIDEDGELIFKHR